APPSSQSPSLSSLPPPFTSRSRPGCTPFQRQPAFGYCTCPPNLFARPCLRGQRSRWPRRSPRPSRGGAQASTARSGSTGSGTGAPRGAAASGTAAAQGPPGTGRPCATCGISIVTVETRAGDPMRLPGRNSGNNSDAEVENLGAGQPWNYYRTKNGLMLEWLSKAVEKDPDAMAIMIDGGDMVFGGCDESFLMSKYQKILSASGGGPNMKMVMGAETACFPFHNAKFFRDNSTWEGRRSAVNRQVENLADDWVLPWSPCGDTKIAPCDPEPQRAYRYPNWGFVMGPVKDLQPLFEFVYNQGSNQVLDQALAQWWMVTHPDRITLDYAGSMVLSLHQWPTGGQTVVRPSRSEGGSGPRARKGGPSFSTRSPSSRAALRMATATAWLSSERLRGA
ncbi:unnamed protein product, partial [Prorocentrum cordatum]